MNKGGSRIKARFLYLYPNVSTQMNVSVSVQYKPFVFVKIWLKIKLYQYIPQYKNDFFVYI